MTNTRKINTLIGTKQIALYLNCLVGKIQWLMQGLKKHFLELLFNCFVSAQNLLLNTYINSNSNLALIVIIRLKRLGQLFYILLYPLSSINKIICSNVIWQNQYRLNTNELAS